MAIPGHINFLIVDDMDIITKTVESNLKELGFTGQFYLANSVSEAKKCLTQYSIHFIISDINMPGDSGIEFLKSTRSNAKHKNLPFVMLTTSSESKDVLNCIDMGASNYIIKPWTLSDLESKIKTAWEKHNKHLNNEKN